MGIRDLYLGINHHDTYLLDASFIISTALIVWLLFTVYLYCLLFSVCFYCAYGDIVFPSARVDDRNRVAVHSFNVASYDRASPWVSHFEIAGGSPCSQHLSGNTLVSDLGRLSGTWTKITRTDGEFDILICERENESVLIVKD